MKSMHKTLLIILIFLTPKVIAQHKKYNIKLVDKYNNGVAFFLLSNNSTVLRSNPKGVLEISKYQKRKYKNEIFTLHFSNHLAYMLYRINLYTNKGTKSSDEHYKSNNIVLDSLTKNLNNNFYLRRKEIRLNDEGEIDLDSILIEE